MKGKKLLSMLTAGALAVSMVMPVMAADGGTVDVDLTTKTGVLRVQVPTTMAIAVDQFEIEQTGAQISSGEFAMENFSEMDVKVAVTSTATLGTGVNLASTVDAVTASTGNDAWLGVAAMTAANSYDDPATASDTENYYDLTDESSNVVTFDSAGKKADQTFYLAKGTGAAGYTLAVPDANGKVDVSYAQFYELTEIGTQPTDDDELQVEVDKADVYVVVTANAGNNGESVTKLARGSQVSAGTYANTNTYYTAAGQASTPAAGKVYVYAAMGTAGGKAGFKYVGKLSNAKATWTADDIKKINIAYSITGVTGTNYDAVKNDCKYGWYQAPIVFTAGATKGAITYTTADVQEVTKIEMTNDRGTFDAMVDKGSTYSKATIAADTDAGTTTITLDAKYMSFYSGNVAATITYKDASGVTKTQVLKLNMD